MTPESSPTRSSMVRRLPESPITGSPSAPTSMERRLLPVAEFARQLGISVWTARQYCYTGRCASNKLGAKLLVPADEVDRLIAETLRPALSA